MKNIAHAAYSKYREDGLIALAKSGSKLAYMNSMSKIVGERKALHYPLQLKRCLVYKSINPEKFSIEFSVNKLQKDSRPTFFGYYDVTPFNTATDKILGCYQEGDRLTAGFFDMPEGKFVKIGDTKAWSWQQGCRLQWLSDSKIIYNTCSNSRYKSTIYDLNEGESYSLEYPVYAVSPGSEFALSFNFARLGRLRDGYGYTIMPDDTKTSQAPKNDGIWKMDLETGSKELILSLNELSNFNSEAKMDGEHHWVNHIFISPKSE